MTHRILHNNLFIVRFSLDDSALINLFFSLLGAIVAECERPRFGQLLVPLGDPQLVGASGRFLDE